MIVSKHRNVRQTPEKEKIKASKWFLVPSQEARLQGVIILAQRHPLWCITSKEQFAKNFCPVVFLLLLEEVELLPSNFSSKRRREELGRCCLRRIHSSSSTSSWFSLFFLSLLCSLKALVDKKGMKHIDLKNNLKNKSPEYKLLGKECD